VGEVVREGVGSKPSQHSCSQAINPLADGYLSVYNRFGHAYLDGLLRRRLGIKQPTQVPYIAERGLAVLFNPSLSREEMIGALFLIAQRIEALTTSRERSRGGGKTLKASKTEKLSSNRLVEGGKEVGRDE
jgi:hypothetical protein